MQSGYEAADFSIEVIHTWHHEHLRTCELMLTDVFSVCSGCFQCMQNYVHVPVHMCTVSCPTESEAIAVVLGVGSDTWKYLLYQNHETQTWSNKRKQCWLAIYIHPCDTTLSLLLYTTYRFPVNIFILCTVLNSTVFHHLLYWSVKKMLLSEIIMC